MAAPPGDRVVRELDVHLCSGVLGSSTQLYLFQYPLRPPWRPYALEAVPELRLKPGARRVELEVPLDTQGPNYDQQADKEKHVEKTLLTSSQLELRAGYAVGSIRGNKLLLSPLDAAVALRPSLAHLDAAAAARPRPVDAADHVSLEDRDEKPQELVALSVQVKRRETERQAEARLNSYAHLAAREAGEPWAALQLHGPASAAADGVWEQLMTPAGGDLPMTLSRQQYLSALVPAPARPLEEDGADAAAAAPASTAAGDLGRPAAQLPGVKAEQNGAPAPHEAPGAWEGLEGALAALFKQYSVCSLENVREWLTKYQDAGAAGAAARSAPDGALHQAVVNAGSVRCIRKSYVLAKLGTSGDALRSVLLDLLAAKEGVRRSDIMEAARAAGVAVSDAAYTRTVKDLCTSKGSSWSIKTGV